MKNHRHDIDGLRAVAILPVVLYHSGLPGLPGGFIGVDIFFVISGFLIAGIIRSEIEAGEFTIVGFYERRARRILPALFFVTMCSIIAAYLILSPADIIAFGNSVAATVLFISNIYFWKDIDYFSTAAEFKPLLHTWSLAVEEQFYIIFPIVMIVISAWRAFVRHAVVVLALSGSLALSVFATSVYPSASFYLIPTRGWELLIGASLAMNIIPGLTQQAYREISAGAGLVMIGMAVFLLTRFTPFPGTAALLPTVGTALIIHASTGGNTIVANFLSNRVLTSVGLISYSLYLWHWPVLSFLRAAQGSADLDPSLSATAIAFSIAAATFSYHLIEQPFRRRGLFARRQIFSFAIAGSGTLLALALVVNVLDGAAFRFDQRTLTIMYAADDIEPNRLTCRGRLPEDGLCRVGVDNETPSALVWGDSHAGAVMSAIDQISKDNDKAAFLAYEAGCPPLLGIRRAADANSERCVRFNNAVAQFIEANRSNIDTVILIARWPLNASSKRSPGEPGDPVFLARLTGEAGPNVELFEYGLSKTLKHLKQLGVRIVILGGVPEIGWNVPRQLATFNQLGIPFPAGPQLAEVERRHAIADFLLSNGAERFDAEVIPLAPLLCTPDCLLIDGDRPLYVDDDHLSVHGARNVLAPKLADQFKLYQGWETGLSPSLPGLQQRIETGLLSAHDDAVYNAQNLHLGINKIRIPEQKQARCRGVQAT